MCVDLPTHQQTDILLRTCPDDGAMVDEVRQLLGGHAVAQSTAFFDLPETASLQTLDRRFPPGTEIGPYEIIEPIGAGGTGTVYLAKKQDGKSNRVAIKVLQPWLRSDEGLARFQNEKRALSRLDHPGIAKWLDSGLCEDGSPYLVMEYIDGCQLDDYLKTNAVSTNRRIECFQAICDAVAAAHEHQILHRDLKPANIIIDTEGKPVITDFGLAKFLEPNATQTNLTTTGRIMGTPKYMAPEQAAGSSDLGMTTDVYGLGAVLYFMSTGRPPFEGNSIIDIGAAIRNDAPRRPRSINLSISRDLDTICLKCLNKRPVTRYPTVAALSDDVARYQRGQPISARPPNTLERLGYWSKRNPSLAALSGALALALVSGIVSLTLLWQTSQRNFTRAENKTAQLLNTIASFTQTVNTNETEPTTLRFRRDVLGAITQAYEDLSDYGPLDSETLYASAVAWFKLGRIKNNLGNTAGKLECFRQAEARFRLLVEREPGNLKYQFDIYHSLVNQGLHANAFKIIQQIVEADLTGDLDYLDALGNALHWQSTELSRSGQYARALEMSNEGKRLARQYFEGDDQIPRYRRQLGTHLFDSAVAEWMLGIQESAILDLNQSIEIARRLVQLEPRDGGFNADLCIRLTFAISTALFRGDPELARELLDATEPATRDYLTAFPTYLSAWSWKSIKLKLDWIYYCQYGSVDELDAAEKRYRKFFDEWLAEFPKSYIARIRLAHYLSHPANEVPDLLLARELFDQVIREEHGAVIVAKTAILAFRFGQLDLAESLFKRERSIYPDVPRYEYYLQAIEVLRSGVEGADTSTWLPDTETMRKTIGISNGYTDVFRTKYFAAEFEAVERHVRLSR